MSPRLNWKPIPHILIPYYIILLTYLAALILTWLILMNRLALIPSIRTD